MILSCAVVGAADVYGSIVAIHCMDHNCLQIIGLYQLLFSSLSIVARWNRGSILWIREIYDWLYFGLYILFVKLGYSSYLTDLHF